MCLIQLEKAAPKRDRIFYKVVHKKSRRTFVRRVKYLPGYTYEAVGNATPIIDPILNRVLYTSGVIHLHTTRKAAECNRCSYEMIIRCKCKPKDFVAWGTEDDVCYRRVTILD